jgi:hypothetical protein
MQTCTTTDLREASWPEDLLLHLVLEWGVVHLIDGDVVPARGGFYVLRVDDDLQMKQEFLNITGNLAI